MSRRLLAAVAAAALTVGLASCGEDGDGPVTTPPPEIDVGQGDGASDGGGDAPSDGGGEADDGDGSTEAAPDIPAPDPADFPGMDEQTPEGAEQAVRFYFASLFWAYQTGDATVLDGLYSEDCDACNGFRGRIEDQPEGQYWSEVSIDDTGVTHVESDNFDIEVGYLFTLGEHSEPGVKGDEREEIAATEYVAGAGLIWGAGGWEIHALEFNEADDV